MPRRQCTSEYKIDVCERIIRRQVVGLQPRQRMPKGVRVVQHFGLSFDEPRRFTKVKARLVGHPWGEARFPLFDQEMSRSGCVAHLKRQDIPHEAPRSSCVFYPFKSNYEWMLLNDNAPVGWARAVEVDDALRRPGTIANRNLMFCAFEGRPLIVRLHGNGRVVEPGDGDWDALIARFPEYPGVRSVVVVDVERVADSCGFAVPLYEYQGERSQLIAYANSKGPEGMEQYKAQKYRASIDGTAGLRSVGGNGR